MIERVTAGLASPALVLDAQRLARELLGDSIAANTFMLAPLATRTRPDHPRRDRAGDRAQCVAIEGNKLAFEWGRRAAHDLAGVEALIAEATRGPSACDGRGSDRAAGPTI